jgi:hypothetical protein
MKNPERVESVFRDYLMFLENERTKTEAMAGRLPPQDPCCVRSYVLKDVAERISRIMDIVANILETPDA